MPFCTSCFIARKSSFFRNRAFRDLFARESPVKKYADFVFRKCVSAAFIADESGLRGFGKYFFISPESGLCNGIDGLIFSESGVRDLVVSARCDRRESGFRIMPGIVFLKLTESAFFDLVVSAAGAATLGLGPKGIVTRTVGLFSVSRSSLRAARSW